MLSSPWIPYFDIRDLEPFEEAVWPRTAQTVESKTDFFYTIAFDSCKIALFILNSDE